MSRTEKTPQDWWATSIIDMKPGSIRFRGYAIEDLIGRIGYAEMVYLLTRGELPHPDAAKLLEAALVAAVDHGPQAPSIAAARMAITCGVGINNAMASAINMLGDVHGGAGEQCVAFYNAVAARLGEGPQTARIPTRWRPRCGRSPSAASAMSPASATASIRSIRARRGCSRWSTRRPPRASSAGAFAAIGRAIEDALAAQKGRRIPMNIDGATGVVYAELGFAPPLCRGLFVLSRSVGALAHAWEEMQTRRTEQGTDPAASAMDLYGPAPATFVGGAPVGRLR